MEVGLQKYTNLVKKMVLFGGDDFIFIFFIMEFQCLE
jgi:hypothetical protein